MSMTALIQQKTCPVFTYLACSEGEVGGGEVPIDEAVGDGALDVRVQTVHPGPQTVPHSRAHIPANGLKCKLNIE